MGSSLLFIFDGITGHPWAMQVLEPSCSSRTHNYPTSLELYGTAQDYTYNHWVCSLL
ncbi:hypothetical protein M404DRAFT_1001031, partial [Pisolithus tinctorius Marx 270]